MAGDWQDLAQASAIGLLFAFLVAKLISTVIAFKEDNLRITRSPPASPTAASSRSPAPPTTLAPGAPPPPSRNAHGNDSSDGSDSDWEGVESTELDEEFSAASGTSVPEEAQLRLHGLYKIATEGPCTAPQPSALKLKARAKWNAWHKLGVCLQRMLFRSTSQLLTSYSPTGLTVQVQKDEDSLASASGSKGLMGPVFSSLMYEEDQGNESELGDIHVSAREGAIDDIVKHLAAGVEVNMRVSDSEGRTPLHWAVDRGHLNVVEILANANADLNAQALDGLRSIVQSALAP